MGRLGLAITYGLSLGACGILDDTPPLPLPPSSSVIEIGVASGNIEFKRRIVDPETIAGVLALLSSNNSGYRYPVGTFPGAQYTLVFRDHERERLVVWVGPDWLGGRELPGSARANRLRGLAAGERAKLLSLIGAS